LKLIALRRQEELHEAARFLQPAPRLGLMSIARRNHCGMEKQPPVFGPFRQSEIHFRLRFGKPAGRRERPRERVVSENVAA
jgi:hypothetical protein